MAFFTSSEFREPLIETETRDALKRRGAETVGLVMLTAAVLVGIIIGTHSPNDPSLFNVTDIPPQNWLGLPGAYAADLMHRAIGWAAWGLPLALGVWGLRFVLHRGEARLLKRGFLVPFAIALGAVFAAAHAPLDSWPYDYGLGGWFGDMVLGGLLSAIPGSLGLTLVAVTLVLLAGLAALSLFALGATWRELAAVGRFVLSGLGLMARGTAQASRAGAGFAKSRIEERRAARGEVDATEKNPGLFRERLMRGYGRRALAAEHPKAAAPAPTPTLDQRLAGDDALMARISAAIAAHDAEGGVAPRPQVLGENGELVEVPHSTLGGVTRDDPVAADVEDDDALLDLPPVAPEASHRSQTAQKVRADRAKPRKSTAARAEEQPRLALGDEAGEAYLHPPLALLEDPSSVPRHVPSAQALEENARMLESVLDDYGVKGEIVSVRPGPVVTMYELEPAPGLKASRVIGLSDDIARSMSALTARVSTVPGRSVIGIELPNVQREKVVLREILSAAAYGDAGLKLPLALGKDISGEPIVANLAKMPHLLIAGTTGSGKSVAINTMILSLLYQLSPEECRLIMIDPKMLELSVYDGIPHLLSPVVTDPKKAVVALKWVVAEMEERYRKMSKMGVRNIEGYNSRVRDALDRGEDFSRTVQTGFDEDTGEPVFETETYAPEPMPFIVVIVDEMADLMMVAGKEIEACIQRLAQMARASGIHLIMATQRPSVDVITGTIKANFPTRISFQVTSKIDSRTILGEQGAEQLLGMGDMLYMAGGGRITRIHGPFVSDEEVEEVVIHLKSLGAPEYVSGVQDGPDDEKASDIDMVLGLGGNTTGEDALYDQAVAIVARDRKCSTSYIQRKLAIGYNKAARLVEQMEDEGVVSQANHVGKREVLVPEVA